MPEQPDPRRDPEGVASDGDESAVQELTDEELEQTVGGLSEVDSSPRLPTS